jgi:hypothetical protein
VIARGSKENGDLADVVGQVDREVLRGGGGDEEALLGGDGDVGQLDFHGGVDVDDLVGVETGLGADGLVAGEVEAARAEAIDECGRDGTVRGENDVLRAVKTFQMAVDYVVDGVGEVELGRGFRFVESEAVDSGGGEDGVGRVGRVEI